MKRLTSRYGKFECRKAQYDEVSKGVWLLLRDDKAPQAQRLIHVDAVTVDQALEQYRNGIHDYSWMQLPLSQTVRFEDGAAVVSERNRLIGRYQITPAAPTKRFGQIGRQEAPLVKQLAFVPA